MDERRATMAAPKLDYSQFKAKYNILANEQQEIAIKNVNGPVLLLAVPGSGKTTVIVARVGYMRYCQGIDFDSILTLTFTRAAAKEMKDRFERKFQVSPEQAKHLHFSTIHSFCVSVLRKAANDYDTKIPALEPENARIIRKIYRDIYQEYAQDGTVKTLATAISYAKNMMIDDDKALATLDKQIETDKPISFVKIYRKYEAELNGSNKMDFDDQLRLALRFLQEFPSLLEWCQEKFKYINVDEAQDTSYIQHQIISLLASKYKNLFMVGDEDQSIYGFRAAYPSALITFGVDYPDAQILYMETNYRSTATIVQRAAEFIEQNDERYPKTMRTDNVQGENIVCTSLLDINMQYEHMLRELKELSGKPNWTVAVLYRNNESAVPLADILNIENIPFNFRDGGNKMFFAHFAVMDVLSLLALSQNNRDLDSFMKVYYKLGAYLSKSDVGSLPALLDKTTDGIIRTVRKYCDVRKGAVLSDVDKSLDRLKDKKPASAIMDILMSVHYIDYLWRNNGNEGSANDSLRKINKLIAIANKYKTIPDFLDRIKYLAEYQGGYTRSNITLSTIHASKGLEFDQVYIIDAQEGVLPSFTTASSAEMKKQHYEEEVRLFYVGATRAKGKLEILCGKMQMGKSIAPSRFIKQILGQEKNKKPKASKTPQGDTENIGGLKNPLTALISANSPERCNRDGFGVGKQIEHIVFGLGIIQSIDADKLSAVFGHRDEHTFLYPACVDNNMVKLA
jgi:DNA helicase-2/ATP-dependent DNA helicase PcrA